MSFNPEDSVQFGLYTFMMIVNEADRSKPCEKELAEFLETRLAAANANPNPVAVMKQIALGSNAIISSLDGSADWHATVLDVANMLFDGANMAFRENGMQVARKAKFGDPLLTELIDDGIKDVSPQSIARDSSTPLERLIELSKDNDWRVKAAVAENPSTPVELLKEMSQDSDEAVRSYVANNPRTPRDIMETLALDQSEYVRDFLAQNPALPVDLMGKLAEDSHWRPRSGVAENPNAPLRLLQKLAADPDRRVADIAEQHPKLEIPF